MANTAGVFISYRRQEASYLAGWLHDCLADYLGPSRIFLDIDWIKPGVDFMRVITEAIARSGVMLVLIGSQWLAVDQSGRRRLDSPVDPVRLEIESALQQDLRIIPMLLDGAPMPAVEELPDGMAKLTRLNALRVGYESFRTDVGRLVSIIRDELGIVISSDTADAAAGPEEQSRPTKAAVSVAPVDTRRDEDQRARLLHRLSRTYTEYLTQSVDRDTILKLQLGLDWLPQKTFRPQDQLLALPEHAAAQLPAGTSLLDAFDRAGGLDGDGLLVLGGPGAGKTTLLFELAQQLTGRAHRDPRHPLPVYLPLSAWATRRPALDQWLADQLVDLYQIPRPLGRRWINDAQLLFLLDGLDEIPDRTDRAACVRAINRFNRFGRSYRLPMVVASRPVEYDTLPVQLQLETAISVRPLDPTVVLDRLRQANPGMEAAAAMVQDDPELLELLRSPLLASMLTLAYAGVPKTRIHATTGKPAERRHQLITDYVNRRFELDRLNAHSTGKPANAFPPTRSRAWLTALARNLIRHQQTVLLLGRLPLDWLPTRWAQWAIMAAPGLLIGPIAALSLGLMAGLDDGLREGLTLALSFELYVGVPAGVGAAIGVGLIWQSQPAQSLSWSWARARSRLWMAAIAGLIVGLSAQLISGLLVVLIVGLLGGLVGLRRGLIVGLVVGLGLGLGTGLSYGLGLIPSADSLGVDSSELWLQSLSLGLPAGMAAGLGAGLVGQPDPAERLSWSWRRAQSRLPTALAIGLLFELIIGLIFWQSDRGFGLSVGTVGGLGAFLVGGMTTGSIPLFATPNEGIRRSARNGSITACLIALVVGLIVGLVEGLNNGLRIGLNHGLAVGLGVGLISGLAYGLGATVQHGLLRLLLYRYHLAPLRYVRWLNYAVRLRLLYRGTSGGYVFIHRMVQDYFSEAKES